MIFVRERLAKYFGGVIIIGIICFFINYNNFKIVTKDKIKNIDLINCDKIGAREIIAEISEPATTSPPKTSLKLQTAPPEESTTGYTTLPIPPEDRSRIKLRLPPEVKSDPLFFVFQSRKKFSSFACQHARELFNRKTSFTEKLRLQKAIQAGTSIPDDEPCRPMMSREGSPENHFYDDKHKFHVCLPTKTGSTNWLKTLLDLYLYDGEKDPSELDSNKVYQMTQMPRFSKQLEEFVRGRDGHDGYFTMMTVRHPFARLYSAWKDKFRNKHPWYVYIKKKFGEYIDLFERQNMTDTPYEVSFEAFLELVAMSKYDTERDRHWKSIQTYCTACNIEYDFILKQETAMVENDFLIAAIGGHHPNLHVPGAYANYSKTLNQESVDSVKTISIEEIAKPYQNISRSVIEQIYVNYYPDFVLYNYSIDEIWKAGRHKENHKGMVEVREKVRKLIYTKFGYYQKRSDDMTCVGDQQYSCQYGTWRKFVNKTLGGTAQPFGQKKFTKLRSAQLFACDKESVKGITWDKGFYYLRGGSTGLRESGKNETTWVKQYSSVTIV